MKRLLSFVLMLGMLGLAEVSFAAVTVTSAANPNANGLPSGGDVDDCVINTAPGVGVWAPCPGAAGGDSVTVNGGAVTDPDFATTGSDLTLTNTSNVITFTLKEGLTVTNWTMVTPDLGTPSAVVLTNATGTAASLTAGTATVANSGDSATSFFSSGTIEDARLPSSMANKVFTGSILIPNDTAVPGTCSIGMLFFNNNATAGVNLYGCTASNTWTLLGDGGGGAAVATDTIWDAAGDLVYGTGSNTASRLAVGTANQILQVNAGATAPEWTSTPTFTSVTVAGGGVGKITLLEGTCTAGGSADEHGVCVDSTTNRLASYENGGAQVNYVASGDNIGAATATTPSANDNDTSVATTAYVQTELTAYASDTVTFTNKTVDCTTAGNVCTIYKYMQLDLVGVAGGTAGHVWDDDPLSTTCTAASTAGTNQTRAFCTFPDSDGEYGKQLKLSLPTGYVAGTLQFRVSWKTTGTGNFRPRLQTLCYASDAASDSAYSNSTYITAAAGTSARFNQTAWTTATDTGCDAEETMAIRFSRNRTEGSDTLNSTADVEFVGVRYAVAQ